MTEPESPDHDAQDPGERFLPGRILAGRYRVVARIGQGGMGEVFRADDLKLGQPVALKFLPQELSEDPSRLSALFAEVRLARQVSHPGVCRVHDIAESDGVHFVSMEFVDGEDLASLLRRIGHLPTNKATEIARETCFALAAIHGRGLLHRDLKPANLMIDGRGHVKITDFGLAELEGTVGDPEMIVGTPAYMAPECLVGGQMPSVRSDLYSLGLTLYELFTGKRAFAATKFQELIQQRRETTPVSPSKLQRDIDPRTEQVILACLDPDPDRRPRSALAVAGALPGGDPITAAIEAGETPSPHAIAAASLRAEGLRPAVAWSCLAALVIGLLAVVAVAPSTKLVPALSWPEPPEAMAARARELMHNLGFEAPAADRAYGFELDDTVLDEVTTHDRTPTRWRRLTETHPSVVTFWYREHHSELIASAPRYRTTYQDPPLTTPGMVGVELDQQGRLRRLDAPVNPGRSSSPDSFDSDVLFEAAGLRLADFQEAPASRAPAGAGDRMLAWTGRASDEPGHPVRVDVVAWQGRPVSFLVRDGATALDAPQASDPSGRATSLMLRTVRPLIFLFALLLGAWLARRNLRAGRGDTKRAVRLGLVLMTVRILMWLLGAHHTASSATQQLTSALAFGLYDFAFGWVIYVAIEPYVRKLWPRWLISWARLLDGQFADARVGRDLLIGTLVGIGMALLVAAHQAVPAWLGLPPGRPDNVGYVENQLTALLGFREQIGDLLTLARSNIVLEISFVVILVIFRLLFRSALAAFIVAFLLFVPLALPKGEVMALNIALAIGVTWFLLGTIRRFGLLAVGTALLTYAGLEAAPLGLPLGSWAMPHGLFVLGLVLAVGGYGFFRALGGRTAFRGALAEE
jgi:serine/threonine-protein kinase